ncbi:MAG: SAM-dependent DNA methyltransferase, partial [Verrucomicrobiaceae bacterium]
ARDKKSSRLRDRRGETLFIDARKLGTMIDRTHRELTDADIAQVAGTYHAWRGDRGAGKYEDVAGFCKSAHQEQISIHGFVLTPGRYVGTADVQDDDEPFMERFQRLASTLEVQFAEGARLDATIRENLRRLGHGS